MDNGEKPKSVNVRIRMEAGPLSKSAQALASHLLVDKGVSQSPSLVHRK